MITKTMEVDFGKHRIVHKECRTVRGRTCSCCRKYIDETCFAIFDLHDNGNQWIIIGFQCFDCDRSNANIFYSHTDIIGRPIRMRQLLDGSWVIHERYADCHGPLDVAMWSTDTDCDTKEDAMKQWNDKVRLDIESLAE